MNAHLAGVTLSRSVDDTRSSVMENTGIRKNSDANTLVSEAASTVGAVLAEELGYKRGRWPGLPAAA